MTERFRSPDQAVNSSSREIEKTPEEKAELLRELLRRGQLSMNQLEVAAYLDVEAAQIALDYEGGKHEKLQTVSELNIWVETLRDRFGREVAIQANFAAASVVLPFFESFAQEHTSLSQEKISYPRMILNEMEQLSRGQEVPIREDVAEQVLAIRSQIRTELVSRAGGHREQGDLISFIHGVTRFHLDTIRDSYNVVAHGEAVDSIFDAAILDHHDALTSIIERGLGDQLSQDFQEAIEQDENDIEAFRVAISKHLITWALTKKSE